MNQPTFNLTDMLKSAVGGKVLAFDVNGRNHYGKLLGFYQSPMPHMTLQSGDGEKRIVFLANCTSILPDPSRAPGQTVGHEKGAASPQAAADANALRIGRAFIKMMAQG